MTCSTPSPTLCSVVGLPHPRVIPGAGGSWIDNMTLAKAPLKMQTMAGVPAAHDRLVGTGYSASFST